MDPQPHGGALRRGNPGNKGRPKSSVAREILEASTPQAARLLKELSLKGKFPGKDGEKLSHPDRIKAINAHLDRGNVPSRSELTGAEGAPFTIAVRAANADD